VTTTSAPLLIIAAGTVGFLHSILPDHWVPLAVIGRSQRWSITRVARISFLASVGHVLTSIIIAGLIALVGLQFRSTFETEQGHIVGVILVLTGIGFLLWGLTGHSHHEHDRRFDSQQGDRGVGARPAVDERSAARRFAAIAVPFGAAASPDLTILPVALAASAISGPVVIACLVSFTLVTLGTFVVLTVAATLAGYQVKGEWLEENGNLLTAVVLIAIGIAVYLGL
jgi:nickel/cobalt exporter